VLTKGFPSLEIALSELCAVVSKTDEIVTICLSVLLKASVLIVPTLVIEYCLGQS